MIKLLTIIGARPQIIKAAAISREIALHFSDSIQEKILHTGQHYDENMSGMFFDELGIPQPDYNLHVGSATHGVQTARIIEGVERILLDEHFDGMIVYGDTNSTLAASIAASKRHVPIFHIEAGVRMYDMAMPEEINRCVCDQLSSILFAPTQIAYDNLVAEGFCQVPMMTSDRRHRQVMLSGDIMYDNSIYFSQLSDEQSHIMLQLGLSSKGFVLATIHRDQNTDNPQRLNAIFSSLLEISELHQMPIVLPLHPRTKKCLATSLEASTYQKLMHTPLVRLIPPASFLDIVQLEKHAKLVITDSGGVQKEAFFFSTPSMILMNQAPWVEIVEHQAGICVDADREQMLQAYDTLSNSIVHFPPIFGNGHAAQQILQEISVYLNHII